MKPTVDRYTIKLPEYSGWESYCFEDSDKFGHPPGVSSVLTNKSTKRQRAPAVVLATYFKREFGYDFIQYEINPSEDHEEDRAYLWSMDDYRDGKEISKYFGCLSVRWREWSNHEPGYALSWVWFHPYQRGRGHLTRMWPWFIKRFPGCSVEHPISPAMLGFLNQNGWPDPEQGAKYVPCASMVS